jgi:aspartate/methionine/tyrosine aminotransferase
VSDSGTSAPARPRETVRPRETARPRAGAAEARPASAAARAARVDHLGTETVFAVAADAAALAAQGKTVFPFHLGDLNIATPANVAEAATRALRAGKTTYCPNAGIPELREAIALDVGRARGLDYGVDNVSVQPGGKPVIGKFLLTMMNPGDEVLYPNPGFPIYNSLIEFFGGRAVPYTYVEGADRFSLDLDQVERLITPRTRLLILNDLHNPTGVECSPQELEALAGLVCAHDLYVLCDEAYFDVRYEGTSASLTSQPGMRERCVILYTFSKKYAMTGWRLGAAIGPRWFIDTCNTLNVNGESCTNQFVQWAGVEALTGDQGGARDILTTLEHRRDVGLEILNATAGVHCVKPNTTFYLYPNVTAAMARTGHGGPGGYESFRRAVLEHTGVSMCTRLHFGPALPGETQRYLRFAYSGLHTDRIREGLGLLKAFIEG